MTTIEQAVEDAEVVPAAMFYKEPEGLPFQNELKLKQYDKNK